MLATMRANQLFERFGLAIKFSIVDLSVRLCIVDLSVRLSIANLFRWGEVLLVSFKPMLRLCVSDYALHELPDVCRTVH